MKRGDPKLPPADLNLRAVPLEPAPGRYWRCADISRPLVDWDRRRTSRFSSPDVPVLYLARWNPRTSYTPFWEVFGEELLEQSIDQRSVSLSQLQRRRWVRFSIPASAALRVVDTLNADTQRVVGADRNTFGATYDVTQEWAGKLFKHPAGIDGLNYASRLDDPKQCLAVFGHPRFLAAGDSLFQATAGLLLSDDVRFLKYLTDQNIAVIR